MEGTVNELSPHMASGRHETAPHWWEASVLTTRHPLPPHNIHNIKTIRSEYSATCLVSHCFGQSNDL